MTHTRRHRAGIAAAITGGGAVIRINVAAGQGLTGAVVNPLGVADRIGVGIEDGAGERYTQRGVPGEIGRALTGCSGSVDLLIEQAVGVVGRSAGGASEIGRRGRVSIAVVGRCRIGLAAQRTTLLADRAGVHRSVWRDEAQRRLDAGRVCDRCRSARVVGDLGLVDVGRQYRHRGLALRVVANAGVARPALVDVARQRIGQIGAAGQGAFVVDILTTVIRTPSALSRCGTLPLSWCAAVKDHTDVNDLSTLLVPQYVEVQAKVVDCAAESIQLTTSAPYLSD